MKWYRYYYQLINTHTVPRTSAHYPHQAHTETTWIKPTHFHKQLSVISASRGARYCQAHDLGVCNGMQPGERMSKIGFYRSMIEIFLLSWFLFFFWDCRLTIIGCMILHIVTSVIATQFGIFRLLGQLGGGGGGGVDINTVLAWGSILGSSAQCSAVSRPGYKHCHTLITVNYLLPHTHIL